MFAEDLSPPAFRFIESLRCLWGVPQLIDLHQERMQRTLEANAPDCPLANLLREQGLIHILTPYLSSDLSTIPCAKLRFVYTPDGLCPPSWQAYTPRIIRHIHLIELDPRVNYVYKWEDRRIFEVEGLRADEEVLFVRGGLLTDTRFSNIVLSLDGELLTPSQPLLFGVMRTHLLRLGRIRPADLTPADWRRADAYYLINAMLPLPLSLTQHF